MKIRQVDINDVSNLLNIYSQYINSTITFECRLPSLEEFRARVEAISSEYPYLVLEDENKIFGYAYAHRFKEREAYQWSAELSIYLDKNLTSKGFGKILYSKLIEILRLQNVRNIYALVTIPNPNSERMHLSMGFKKLAVFENSGYKCKRWIGVMWFEKNILPYSDNPEPFKSIKKIPQKTIENILLTEK